MSDRPNQATPGDEARGGVDCAYVRDLAEGYVLDAVEPLERARIEAHLADCAECRALIAGLRGTVAFMSFIGAGDVAGVSDATRPSANAKAIVMARVTGRAPVAAEPGRATSAPAPVTFPQVAVERSDRFNPAFAVVPMAAAVMLALVWSFTLQNQLNRTEDQLADNQQANLSTLLTAPVDQSRMFALKPMCTDCGHGKVQADTENNMVQIYAGDLDPAMGHEVWLIGGNNHKEKVGNLKLTTTGDCINTFQLDRPLTSYHALVISGVPLDSQSAEATPELMIQPIAALPPGSYMMSAS